ncbi:MAG: YbgF trimerization domain-containing protein [Rugosibacter sp.]|jgi:tol-pal system protein YbgF|nr:hypothetical protein [Rugosibacter sp.]
MRRTLALCTLLIALPAHAGLFGDDLARQRIEQLRSDVNAVTQRVDTINNNQIDFANQLENVRAELAKLRGQQEVMAYELEAAQKRQKDFYIDLDNRLRKLEPAIADSTAAPAAPADGAQETKDYETALNLLKASKFKEAGARFLAFLAAWPDSTLQASATYWGAYAHAQAADHKQAAALFGKFAATWPKDERAPDALEGQADSLHALKAVNAARDVLQKLSDTYPNSDAGKRAKQQLKAVPAKKK